MSKKWKKGQTVMLLNVNRINMSKRFNHEAGRLKEVIHKYQLDAVGLQ